MSWVIDPSWCRVVLLYCDTPPPLTQWSVQSVMVQQWYPDFGHRLKTVLIVLSLCLSWLSQTGQSETCRDSTDWLQRSGVGTWLTTSLQQVLGDGVLRDPRVSTLSSHPVVEDSDGAELSSFSWSVIVSAVLAGFCSRLVSVRSLKGLLKQREKISHPWGAPTLTGCWKCFSLLSVSKVVIHRQEESGTVSRVSLEWSTSRIGPSLPHLEQRILKFQLFSFDQDHPTKRNYWQRYIVHKNHQNPEGDISKTLSLVWRKTLKRSSRARVKLVSLTSFCCLSQQHSTITVLQE